MSDEAHYFIAMVRSGECEWNQKNLFCGWFDSDLSKKGKEEAVRAGKALKDAGITFDEAHTSELKRAQITLDTILKEMGQTDIPIHKTWRLNESHCGGLTGLNKSETAEKYGEDQAQKWRRNFDVPPPPMNPDHPYYKEIMGDQRYVGQLKQEGFPKSESFKSTVERTLPYWNESIVPKIKDGKAILIAAHRNSLAGIVKHLDNISDEKIMDLNLPTGVPFVYEFDENMKKVWTLTFIGDEETVNNALKSLEEGNLSEKSNATESEKQCGAKEPEKSCMPQNQNNGCVLTENAACERGK